MDSTSVEKNLASERAQGAVYNVLPFRPVSLLDMLRHHAEVYIEVGRAIESTQAFLKKHSGAITGMPGDTRDFLVKQLTRIREHTTAISLDVSTELINLLVDKFNQEIPSWNEAHIEMENVFRTIKIELKKRVFYYFPPEEAVYLELPEGKTFTTLVRDNFSSVHADVRAASSCLGFGLYTASVFHSMRIVEKGLGALAVVFSVPFQFEQWQTVIEQIESKVKDLKNLPKGQQKSEDQQFYSEAAKEFSYFKDAWRNHVMHGRASYEKPEAERIHEHVRHFMNHLAKRLKE